MKKKLTLVVTCVVLVAAMVIGGTLAYFTDTTQEENNVFTVGAVKITLDEPEWDKLTEAKKTLNPGNFYVKDPTITVDKDSQDSYIFLDMSINKFSSLFWVMAADASADTKTKGLENFTIFNADGTVMKAFLNDNGVFSTTKFIEYMKANPTVFQAMIGKWFQGISHEDWKVMGIFYGDTKVKKDCLTIRLGYQKDGGVVKANMAIKFMEKFGMPASVTQEMIDAGTNKNIGNMKNTFNTNDADFHIYFTAYAIQADTLETLDKAYTALFNK